MRKNIVFALAALLLGPSVAFAASPAMSTSTSAHHAKSMAMKTKSSPPSPQRMTKALNLLEAKGYGGFTNFKADGSDFTASVMRNGRDETVRVDPDTGKVMTQKG